MARSDCRHRSESISGVVLINSIRYKLLCGITVNQKRKTEDSNMSKNRFRFDDEDTLDERRERQQRQAHRRDKRVRNALHCRDIDTLMHLDDDDDD